jgi:hypothetical protein
MLETINKNIISKLLNDCDIVRFTKYNDPNPFKNFPIENNNFISNFDICDGPLLKKVFRLINNDSYQYQNVDRFKSIKPSMENINTTNYIIKRNKYLINELKKITNSTCNFNINCNLNDAIEKLNNQTNYAKINKYFINKYNTKFINGLFSIIPDEILNLILSNSNVEDLNKLIFVNKYFYGSIINKINTNYFDNIIDTHLHNYNSYMLVGYNNKLLALQHKKYYKKYYKFLDLDIDELFSENLFENIENKLYLKLSYGIYIGIENKDKYELIMIPQYNKKYLIYIKYISNKISFSLITKKYKYFLSINEFGKLYQFTKINDIVKLKGSINTRKYYDMTIKKYNSLKGIVNCKYEKFDAIGYIHNMYGNKIYRVSYCGVINYTDQYEYGIMIYTNNNIYIGTFTDNIHDDFGTLFYNNGDKYTGDFYEGLKEGYGIMEYKNGDVYYGEWENNKKDGVGTYIEYNGRQYKSYWINNIEDCDNRKYFISPRQIINNFKKFDAKKNLTLLLKSCSCYNPKI